LQDEQERRLSLSHAYERLEEDLGKELHNTRSKYNQLSDRFGEEVDRLDKLLTKEKDLREQLLHVLKDVLVASWVPSPDLLNNESWQNYIVNLASSSIHGKIGAIKAIRTVSNAGIREAKELVESWMDNKTTRSLPVTWDSN
jgi:ribosomal protein L7/L12